MKHIYNDKGAKIYVTNSILNIELYKNAEYNESNFDCFLEYFKNTWIYNNQNNIKMYLKISVISTNTDEIKIPISAYIKLVKILGDLHNVFKNNLHSMVILTDDKKIEDIYNLVLKFYDPPDKRPILFTSSNEEADKFFKINKLID